MLVGLQNLSVLKIKNETDKKQVIVLNKEEKFEDGSEDIEEEDDKDIDIEDDESVLNQRWLIHYYDFFCTFFLTFLGISERYVLHIFSIKNFLCALLHLYVKCMQFFDYVWDSCAVFVVPIIVLSYL